jgi:hypothetical protein
MASAVGRSLYCGNTAGGRLSVNVMMELIAGRSWCAGSTDRPQNRYISEEERIKECTFLQRFKLICIDQVLVCDLNLKPC